MLLLLVGLFGGIIFGIAVLFAIGYPEEKNRQAARRQAERLSAAVTSRYGAVITHPDRIVTPLKNSGRISCQIDNLLITLNDGTTIVCTLDVHEVDGAIDGKAVSGAGELRPSINS